MKRTPKNQITARIHNASTMQLVNELAEKRGNRNAVLNDILDRGAPLLYAEVFGGKTSPAQPSGKVQPSVGRELKELRRDLDDVYVLLNIFEPMIVGLYNLAAEQLDGEPVNAEELRSGTLSDLPPELADIKREITERHRLRKGGKNG